jgi:tRNA C32,U32 (ribose-2'-O)-methylase TrmJ
VIGTSGRIRRKGPQPIPVRSVASHIVHRAEADPGALVFGPESDGLSLHDLARCDAVVRIPQRTDGPALNLAQAVAIVASELFQAALVPAAIPPPRLTDRRTRIRVAERMARVARHCGLPVRNRPEEFSEALRGMLARHEYTPHELAIFECWLTQMEWFVGLSNALPSGGACDG